MTDTQAPDFYRVHFTGARESVEVAELTTAFGDSGIEIQGTFFPWHRIARVDHIHDHALA